MNDLETARAFLLMQRRWTWADLDALSTLLRSWSACRFLMRGWSRENPMHYQDELQRCEFLAEHYLKLAPKSDAALLLLREREHSRMHAYMERDAYLRKIFGRAALAVFVMSGSLGFAAGRIWEHYAVHNECADRQALGMQGMREGDRTR